MIIRLLGCMILLVSAGCTPQHTVVLQRNTVVISLHDHEAEQVSFASSLDQFTVHRAWKAEHGQWVVAGLPNREFQYFFLVDGKVLVPECRFKVNDDFGTVNCRYFP